MVQVSDFEDYYITEDGNVISYKGKKPKVLNKIPDGGYLKVNLCKDGKGYTRKVHRLVAEAFIPNPLGLSQVNHIDEDKTNNRVENLEWVTPKDNLNYGTRNERAAKTLTNRSDLSKPVVAYIYESGEYYGEYPSAREASRQLGVRSGDISKCCKGKLKHTGDFAFRFK